MIEHLSAEQISQWMIGERPPQLERHVGECEECRSELRQLEATLQQFRGSVREWGNSAAPPVWREPSPRASSFSWPRMALAAAALFVLASIPVYWGVRQHQRAIAAAQAEDAQLMESIHSSLSRAVPEPMEPLVNLVSWNSGADQNAKVETR